MDLNLLNFWFTKPVHNDNSSRCDRIHHHSVPITDELSCNFGVLRTLSWFGVGPRPFNWRQVARYGPVNNLRGGTELITQDIYVNPRYHHEKQLLDLKTFSFRAVSSRSLRGQLSVIDAYRPSGLSGLVLSSRVMRAFTAARDSCISTFQSQSRR
jgi:hypothetical protein